MPKKKLEGTVISDRMEKTVVVSVKVQKRHPVYKKLVRGTKKFMARDELGVKTGDTVLIEEVPPYSKSVTWKVIKDLSKDKG